MRSLVSADVEKKWMPIFQAKKRVAVATLILSF